MMRVQRWFRQIVPVVFLVAAFHLNGSPASAGDEEFKWDNTAPVCGQTSQIFTSPREKLTEDYVTGRFG